MKARTKKPAKPKLTEEQKAWRRREQSAARKNAKIEKETPLFVDFIPKHTAESEYHRWRLIKAAVAEDNRGCINIGEFGTNKMCHIFTLFTVYRMWTFCRARLGDEVFERLDAYCRRTFTAGETYWYGFWIKVLTGEKVEIGMKRQEPTPEFKARHPLAQWMVVPEYVFTIDNPMTRDEAYALFPYKDPPEPAPVDDGGAAELLAAAFGPKGGAS